MLAATVTVPRTGQAWHALDAREVARILKTDADGGLADDEARRRLLGVGPNRVGDQPERSLWRLALDQFRGLVVLLLLGAAAIAWFLGEPVEAIAILAALLLNATIGFATEWRARISLARLRALVVPRALVKRGGHVRRARATDLVPGDLIVLEAGAQVPADARLLASSALRLAEAALTGESEPVVKDAGARLRVETELADQRTMVYLGTNVVGGSGTGIVTATGVATELGRIGQLVAMAGDRRTPLERQIEGLGRRLILLSLAVGGVVGVAGIIHGEPVGLMLETAISLAVAAIPEGLPTVTTVALAAGLWRLAKVGALVRRLPAVETLGSTTVICADKTGTMTENRMTVARLVFDGGTASLEAGAGLEPRGDPELTALLEAAVLASDVTVERAVEGVRLHGDPTEVALVEAAMAAGIDPLGVARQWPRRREIPFDPGTRLMATFHEGPDGTRATFVKGAPATVLAISRSRRTRAGPRPLEPGDRERLLAENRALARAGLRVLALAWRPEWTEGDRLEGLTFLGLVGLHDPLRPGVREAIARCREAGIRTIMLTGDQQSTAEAIGHELGLAPEAIRSRVSPEEKLSLVAALQAAGEIVAMTGDGVNDAPALARADIGVAMGRHGTDIARAAADLVLTDDNFHTIVEAVEEGRVIHANLRKVIHFLFSCNLSEILAIFVAIVAGLPAPLFPLQILWVNLVTDILPAMALIRDPAEPDVMRRAPRDPAEALVPWTFVRRMLLEGGLLAAGVLSGYFWTVRQMGGGAHANTIAFVALVLIHPFQAMHCRSERLGWWRLPPNRLVWASLGTLTGLQWLAVSWPPLARLLGTVPLSAGDWLVMAVAVLWPVGLLELVKVWGNGAPMGHASPTR